MNFAVKITSEVLKVTARCVSTRLIQTSEAIKECPSEDAAEDIRLEKFVMNVHNPTTEEGAILSRLLLKCLDAKLSTLSPREMFTLFKDSLSYLKEIDMLICDKHGIKDLSNRYATHEYVIASHITEISKLWYSEQFCKLDQSMKNELDLYERDV